MRKNSIEIKYGISPKNVRRYGLLGLCQFVGALTLVVILIIQQDDWRGIDFLIFGLNILIPWAGLIAVGLNFVGFLSIFTDPHWYDSKKSRTESTGSGSS